MGLVTHWTPCILKLESEVCLRSRVASEHGLLVGGDLGCQGTSKTRLDSYCGDSLAHQVRDISVVIYRSRLALIFL
jgi:hypothetical protein